MSVNKKDVIQLLERVAILLELKAENPFKISAYRKAAQALERDNRSLDEIEDFTKIKGIGKGTAKVITDFIETGKSETLSELEEEVPKGLIPLLELPGLGGKKLAKLYQELAVVDANSLKKACENGRVQTLKGFGKKTEEKILESLNNAGKQPERLPIASVLPLLDTINNHLESIDEVIRFQVAGSMRRYRETVKDLDYIVAADHPEIVREKLLQMEGIIDTIASGNTKVSIILQGIYQVNVDFRLVKEEEFPTALHHFTGSKDHNVLMRQLVKAQGKKISEYGVEDIETGEITTFDSEEDFYESFGLHYIPPELRQGKGEIELAAKQSIDLVHEADIKGDLHMHTTWSDGAQSLEEMVIRAKEKGYQYIAITDHSKYLRVANGLNEERLRKQRMEIEKLREKHTDIHIFAGVEMDILPDGRLDFKDEFLGELDFVIASIHSAFQQTQEQIHYRLLQALTNPHVDMIAHPTGRLLGRRSGYSVNVDWLIEKAKETNTILELNANPSRLDLSAEWAERAQENGVPIAVNTDAHSYYMLEYMTIGCGTARRGKLKKDTVINTWSKDKLIGFLQDK